MSTEREAEQRKLPHCPKCRTELDVLLFMGRMLDGFVCPKCRIWFSEDLKPLATVVS